MLGTHRRITVKVPAEHFCTILFGKKKVAKEMASSSFGRAIHWANAVEVILPHSFSDAYASHYLLEINLQRMIEVEVTLILTVRDENLTDLMKLLALLRAAKDRGIEPKSVELHVVSATKCEKLLT